MPERQTKDTTTNARLRALPSVSAVLARPMVSALSAERGPGAVAGAVRQVVARARERLLAGLEADVSDEAVAAALREDELGSLRPVLNATGVLLHTNLGRAPLAREAVEAVARVGSGFCALEYDVEAGARGDRHGHVTRLLCGLTGAEDAAVVNNNAAAMLLVLSALSAGREVVISRGELVEIGGGFRIPDVLRQSGAKLVEVGTTNRTHLRDYRDALTADSAMILKVHPSSFAVVGFTAEVPVAELAPLARERGVALVHDAGSGSLFDDEPGEPHVRTHLEAGADLVLFSGDKLLGGPQAGVVVGRRELVERVRRHPLMRAVRPDKLCLAALHATLRLWRDAPGRVPVARLKAATEAELEARARKVCDGLRGRFPEATVTVAATTGRLGGGSSPLRELPGWAVRVGAPDAERLARALRRAPLPVVGRVERGAVLLDMRSVMPDDDERLEASAAWALAEAGAAGGEAPARRELGGEGEGEGGGRLDGG